MGASDGFVEIRSRSVPPAIPHVVIAGLSRGPHPANLHSAHLPAGCPDSPSRRINVAQIGCGRMGTEDLEGTMAHIDLCRIVAVCDLDSKRLAAAKTMVEQFYKGKGETTVKVDAYHDYHEMLARPDIDAVIVTPPDHWHAIVAVHGGAGRQGSARAEAADLRHPRSDRVAERRPGEEADSAGRQPAAVVETVEYVPHGDRSRAERADRRPEDDSVGIGQDRPKGRHQRRSLCRRPSTMRRGSARRRSSPTWRTASTRRTAWAGPAGSRPKISASA